MKLNKKEITFLSLVIAIWGIILISSGYIMTQDKKTIVKKTYNLNVSTKKITEIQAKKNEVKLKEITTEEGTPISTDIKDYLENPDQISDKMLKELAQNLDTSNVNVNQPGTYIYTIVYKKKTYQNKIIVEQKKLPKMTLTLKEKKMTTVETISRNIREYVYEEISDEIYDYLVLDISEVIEHQKIPGRYKYSITYDNTTYYGDFIIIEPGDYQATITCPADAVPDTINRTCICENGRYNPNTKTCE